LPSLIARFITAGKLQLPVITIDNARVIFVFLSTSYEGMNVCFFSQPFAHAARLPPRLTMRRERSVSFQTDNQCVAKKNETSGERTKEIYQPSR
jgi:hypothetical protein